MTTGFWKKAADNQYFSWGFTFYFYPPDKEKV